MQNYSIDTDESGKELNEHGSPWYPIAAYDEHFSKFALKEVPWHWHTEVELIIVVEGAAKVHCLGNELELQSGDFLFINSNILHRLTQIGSVDCHIINFVLDPAFIGGSPDSQIYQNYVRPICQDQSITAIKLTPNIPWENDAIMLVHKAFKSYTNKGHGHEMIVKSRLIEFWHALCVHSQQVLKNTPASNDIYDQRLAVIIKHIHNHTSDKLTVRTIAESAIISQSECFRLFKKKLDTTPMEYVLLHRLQSAATMLVESSESILDIAMSTGFGSSSYFSKKFKDHYDMTPKKFRSAYRQL